MLNDAVSKFLKSPIGSMAMAMSVIGFVALWQGWLFSVLTVLISPVMIMTYRDHFGKSGALIMPLIVAFWIVMTFLSVYVDLRIGVLSAWVVLAVLIIDVALLLVYWRSPAKKSETTPPKGKEY